MRRDVIAILCGAILATALALLCIYGFGSYGIVLFAGVPFLAGFVPTALIAGGKPRRFWYCVAVSLISIILVALGFIVAGSEGALCLITAIPFAFPLILLGVFCAHRLFHYGRLLHPQATTLIVVALSAALAIFEASARRDAKPPVYAVADSVLVHASADEVWRTIVALEDVDPPSDPFLRTGIAVPQRTRIVAQCNGGLRVCTLSTGILLERIDRWEPGQRLAWRALSTPPPLDEMNPFHHVDAPHLHGYFRNVRGEFALERVGRQLTHVTRRTWYEQDLYPAAYWRIWCDIGASRIHRFILGEVKRAAERRAGART